MEPLITVGNQMIRSPGVERVRNTDFEFDVHVLICDDLHSARWDALARAYPALPQWVAPDRERLWLISAFPVPDWPTLWFVTERGRTTALLTEELEGYLQALRGREL